MSKVAPSAISANACFSPAYIFPSGDSKLSLDRVGPANPERVVKLVGVGTFALVNPLPQPCLPVKAIFAPLKPLTNCVGEGLKDIAIGAIEPAKAQLGFAIYDSWRFLASSASCSSVRTALSTTS